MERTGQIKTDYIGFFVTAGNNFIYWRMVLSQQKILHLTFTYTGV
jgi:hypothetical protein